MEYHQHKTDGFYNLFKGSNTKEGLLIIITTAGEDLTYPCYTQEYRYASQLLDPNNSAVVNDSYFADICEVDEDDDLDNIENWKKANPLRMTYQKGIDAIKDEYEEAKVIPEKMLSFKTKCLNLWVSGGENKYMDMEKWQRCEVESIAEFTENKGAYVGVDISSKIDLTSVAFVFPVMENGKIVYYVDSHSFSPNREILTERAVKDSVPYLQWRDMGYVSLTNSAIIDQQYVIDWVLDYCKKHNWYIKTFAVDPHNAGKFMMDLSEMGYTVEEVYQSHQSLNEATNGFREQVYEGNVKFKKNPVLTFAMSNAVVRQSNGNIKIDKDAVKQKIDPVDAVLCGYKLAIYHDFKTVDRHERFKKFMGMI